MAKNSGFLTTGEKVRSYLAVAFVASLAIHFVLSPFFPNLSKHQEDQQVEQVQVKHKAVVKVPTPPPPTPTPAPTPTPPPNQTPPPKVVQQKQLVVAPPKTSSQSKGGASETGYQPPKGGGDQNGVPGGPGTEGPPATPKPACANPNQEASVTNAMQADYPDSARDLGLGPVVALVQVTVGASGNLVAATIYKGSGNGAIDTAAIRAARQSTYAPKLVNCLPVQGDYLFRAEFNPD